MHSAQNYLLEQTDRLSKALTHLEYSYKKILNLPDELSKLDEESLETWESFSARFSRVADLFMTKYLRARILMEDPGFSGTLRDFVNQGEKINLIDNVEKWMGIRELRNISAHEYTDKDLIMFFKRLKMECPRLLSIRKLLGSYASDK